MKMVYKLKYKFKIIRTFNSSGDIIFLEMKGEGLFKSFNFDKKNELKYSKNNSLILIEELDEKKIETTENFYNLGLINLIWMWLQI